MEQYPVPQFIEREAKLAFFISFKQTLYLIVAGALCFILYYVVPRFLFLILATLIMGGAAALAFVKINGVPLPLFLLGQFGFLLGTKNYTWKKKETLYPFKRISVKKAIEMEKETSPLTMAKGSQLKNKKTKIEF